MPAQQGREHWKSRFGFLMAAIGSAVGLGNMWRFSYLTAEHGGAAFVILYILMIFVIALPVLLAEMAIGRGAARGPIQALGFYGGKWWKSLGVVFVAAGFLIASYYSVIAGWTLRYTLEAVFLGFPADPVAHFAEVSSGWDALTWHLLFMAASLWIVANGVAAGIERTSIIVMPLLLLVVCGLAAYAATLPDSAAGYRYYLNADDYFEIFSREVLADAAGQAFFSLSLGMGAMLTYASYLDRTANLPVQSTIIAFSDFAIAFIAGLVVFPLLFALGLSQEVSESTLGALFITLPKAFLELGLIGRAVGTLFFAALVVGALTSLISLLEVVVASTVDLTAWDRRKATLATGIAAAVFGIPAAIDLSVLDAMDQVATHILLIGGGLALAIFTGWVMPDPEREIASGAGHYRWFPLWRRVLRFAVPLTLGFLMIESVPRTIANVLALFD
jgi:NSS family neurotransmitter:Na+ symporter